MAERLGQSLLQASADVAAMGLAPGTAWGQLQTVQRGGQCLAIPGGDGKPLVYNAITSRQRPTFRGEGGQ
ncbi:hypothetical protein [Pseudomonas typographi]|uniref:Uncharacterized protein n=1 Tax=Pseudomonas typographi TaxID=2715964 RepID=A0ABR7Z7E5_9PSED|nr:hypothetical protein [Pseudomonas typographi]MBD1554509.1 hypothetical protein [Pseudomonas typographi]MBD1601377.1 hypothetical protein [Pseudomonas typographi]